jgi:hypothetical protein
MGTGVLCSDWNQSGVMINIENLKILADYAENHDPARFDMSNFARSPTGKSYEPSDKRLHECGTICCFAGLGPTSGIDAVGDVGWFSYVKRIFTDDIHVHLYLFSGCWANSHFNTLQDAIARARTVIALGAAPDDWTWSDPKVLEVEL